MTRIFIEVELQRFVLLGVKIQECFLAILQVKMILIFLRKFSVGILQGGQICGIGSIILLIVVEPLLPGFSHKTNE